MKLKITKSDKKALLAALAVCGIGILFSILIVLGWIFTASIPTPA